MSSGIEAQVLQPYKYGFVTDIESETVPPGLSEDVIRLISQKKGEPSWMLDWRLKAYRNWLKMPEPHWANVQYGPIDYQAISYYAAPSSGPSWTAWSRSIPSCSRRSRSSGSLSRSGNGSRGWRWTQCSIRSPSRPPSARSSRST